MKALLNSFWKNIISDPPKRELLEDCLAKLPSSLIEDMRMQNFINSAKGEDRRVFVDMYDGLSKSQKHIILKLLHHMLRRPNKPMDNDIFFILHYLRIVKRTGGDPNND